MIMTTAPPIQVNIASPYFIFAALIYNQCRHFQLVIFIFFNQLHHQAEKGAPVNADLKDIPMHGATHHHPGDTVHQSPS